MSDMGWIANKRLYCLIAAIMTGTLIVTLLNPVSLGIVNIREWRSQRAGETAAAKQGSEDKFYVYSWNEELEEKLAYVTAQYPELADRIEYVQISSMEYQEALDELLADPGAKKYPDLIAMEPNYIKSYTDSDYLLPVEECGLTEEDMAEMYDYTLQVGADSRDGSVKAVSWLVCPGAFVYRTDLAESLLGVESPEEMQIQIDTWAAFLATAKQIKQKSGGSTQILSSSDDIMNVFYANKIKSWVSEEGTFQMDPAMEEYMDVYRQLEDKALTQETLQWSEEWLEGFANDEVFGYFGCTWTVEWVMKYCCGGERKGEGTYGLWNICQGPAPYYWGGSWIAATQECSDPELAGLIMKTICCEEDTMLKMYEDSLDFMNNRAVMEKLSAAGSGKDNFLGGQDAIAVFSEVADQIDVPFMSKYDDEINALLYVELVPYAYGDKKKKNALADFESSVLETFPELKAED